MERIAFRNLGGFRIIMISVAELFHNLRERDLRKEGICIGEGPFVVERMVRSGWNVKAVLCSEGMVDRALKITAGGVPLETLLPAQMRKITGFDFFFKIFI